MAKAKLNIGLVGCGSISGIYLRNLTGFFQDAEITKCADLDLARAEQVAAATNEAGEPLYPNVSAVALDDIFAAADIDLILNLTTPQAHCEVALRAIANGKHTYGEKPLAVSREDGQKMLAAAKEKGVRLGAAPDTFLGAGIQGARKLIDDGWLGEIVAANAYMCCHGHEKWHPAPDFYYLQGGGPMFDMGPYYFHALINLLGPVAAVSAMTSQAYSQRLIPNPNNERFGEYLKVEVPTHLTGQCRFHSGALATVIMSFDTWNSDSKFIEIHGTAGSLAVPDPNCFGSGGALRLSRGGGEWQTVPQPHAHSDNSRGIGVADLANAVAQNRPHRASGELAMHALDIMHAFHDAAAEKREVTLQTTCQRPAPLALENLAGFVA